MRMGAWDSQLQGHRGAIRPKTRLREVRKARTRWVELEGLENRTLLATIPAATATAGPQNISSMFGNAGGANASQSSSVVVVDPTNPTKLVSVWVDNDPSELPPTDNIIQAVLEGAYSVDGGQNWLPFLGEPTNGNGIPVDPELFDPTTSGPTVPYKYVTDPSMGFDASGNFYILTEYGNAASAATATSGAVVLQKYSFTGDAPAAQTFTSNQQTPNPYGGGFGLGGGGDADLKVIYQWDSSGANDTAIDATMSVDDNLSTIPTGVTSQADAYAGDIYVSWMSVDRNTAVPLANFNPNRIKLEVSSDGGNNFSPLTVADINDSTFTDDGNVMSEHDTTPAVTVSQGRLPAESGQAGDAGIPGGQVTVGWDNFANGNLMANTVSPGRDYSFGVQYNGFQGSIPFGTYLTGGTPYALPVSISNTADLNSLEVTVNIVDSNDATLGLYLEAPSGDLYELVVNQTIDTSPTTSTTFTGQGISGANVGVMSYTNNNIAEYAMGTTFADTATRDIFDPTAAGANGNTAPYIGQFAPEAEGFGGGGLGFGQTLDGFLAQEIASKAGINGTWHLVILDSNTSAPTSPNFIINWSLSFGRGLEPDNDVVLPTGGLVIGGSATAAGSVAVPSSPVDIGPGLVMAQDNTLGANSPYEGRIYAAFVGYYNVTIFGVKNPTSNTDIFLMYSDDGGRTWSDPVEVNDDNGQTDGFSGANENLNGYDQFTGTSQYDPQIAVDPTTGTVVLSWRDARNDPTNNTLVSTYITASIDGGNTFSPQVYANPQSTAVDAITGATDILGPEADNGTAADNSVNAQYGFGTSMGLAVYDGQLYPVWAGNFDEASIVNGALAGNALSIYYRPMVITAGPRVVNSTMGPIPLSEAESGQVSFTVTFDRPINPPGVAASFSAADVQVFYQDTTFGNVSIPLDVLGVTPIASSGVGPDNKFGYTQFKVVFDPAKVPGGGSSGIVNYTGTYSYMVTPDDEAGDPIESPIPSFVISDVAQPVIGPIAAPAVLNGVTNVPLRIPLSGTGGSGTNDDFTTSMINVTGYANQIITGITVNLSLTHQNDSDLTITLTAPDGQSHRVYQGTFNGPVTFNNQAFNVNGLAGSRVDGTYTLTIDDTQANNTGELNGWSVTIDSELPTYGLQTGAPMDQNADGTTDENPLTMPDGYTGLTPGDVYAVPTPDPTVPMTFTTAQSILTPPFSQNTLPLIVPGPQVIATAAIGTSGQVVSGSTYSQNELVDDTSSQYQVTFDRPIQTSTFTPSQVLSIMGPTGSITGPQTFAPTSVDQMINAATPSGSGTLDSSLTINSDNTLQIADITVSLNIASRSDSALTAVLVAPNGTTIPLFSGVGGASGQNFVNTVFDDSAPTAITTGTPPFTGSFKPEYTLNSATLTSLQGMIADGTWQLEITNTKTGVTATLDTWSLTITPAITVTPVAATVTKINGVSFATAFTIGFPQQQVSGTYTIQLGPGIQDQFGDGMDPSGSAGLDVLRDFSQNGPTTTVNYPAADLPKTIPAATASTSGSVSSSIVVPDSFIIVGDQTAAGKSVMQVQLNISFSDDPALTATLYHYDTAGDLLGQVTLFSGVGNGTNAANFNNTVLDDNAPTPIQEGSAPFFATYDPQESLATVFAPPTGMNVQGTWTLVVQNSSAAVTTGTINSWALTFQKSLPTSGLGQPGSGNTTVAFQIFTLAQTNALSSQEWTAVGGESNSFGAGEVTAIAVDPSDPSGNTVYAAGASGGVWKTTDFLTTNPAGPTWIPLTSFGPSSAVNIASIAIYPRNHDPNQSIIVAATGGATAGENNTDAPGVGFLISTNGGQTWALDDSTDNVDANGNPLPIDSTGRNREFVGTTAYQVAIDPQPTPGGGVIIYAALAGTNGGIWRSENSGQTWTQVLTGTATAVVLDVNSGIILDPTTGTNIQGNLQIVYAGIEGVGVEMSTNQGQSWTLMAGGIGNPLIEDTVTGANDNPPLTQSTPNGAEGRITLTVPATTTNAVWNQIYSGWLYAAVATSAGGFDGLFVTKDFGENWTKVNIATALGQIQNTQTPLTQPVEDDTYNQATPSNDTAEPAYPLTDENQGNLDLSLTVDPTDPSILYLGGFGGDNYNSDTGLIRVDTTDISDAHALVSSLDQTPGHNLDLLELPGTSIGASTYDNILNGPPVWEEPAQLGGNFSTTPYLNFIRDPFEPFVNDAALYVFNYSGFTNNGGNVKWIPFDMPGTAYQAAVAETDPATGLPRLIFGNDDGIWSVLDNNGTFENQIGSSTPEPSIDRNGNLQIAQFYNGAVQPSAAAATAADSLFSGAAQNTGVMSSVSSVLADGNLGWTSAPETEDGFIVSDPVELMSASTAAVDQQGSGTSYTYTFPFAGAAYLDFVQVDGVGRTFGLLQASNSIPGPTDPQWLPDGIATLVVNPVNSSDLLISSGTGNIFESTNQGVTWFDIGTPATFGSPANPSLALAFGAPDPSAPEGVGNLGNFLYVGTEPPSSLTATPTGGSIYVSQNAGGAWTSISTGLDGSAVKQIITDPARGSHDAYAVTADGVYYIANSIPSASNPTPTWVNITGDLKTLAYTIFGQSYNPATDTNAKPYDLATVLNSIAANWNYTIPNNPTDLADGYHPVLYVAANSGVYMSTDNGTTWSLYPSTTFGAVTPGGYLPQVNVTNLSLSQGDIAVATGMPNLGGPYNPENPNATPDPDLLMASTYGQGAFAINLAPMLFNTPTNPVQVDSSDTSGTTADGTTIVDTSTPTIDGLSEISGFGGATWVSIVNETPGDATFGQIIGGFNPQTATLGQPNAANASNSTNSFGNFAIPVSTPFGSNGLKTIAIYTTDDAGSQSNKVSLTFMVQATNIVPPPPTTPPPSPTLALSTVAVVNGVAVTNSTSPELTGTTVLGTFVTVTEVWETPPSGTPETMTLPSLSDINSDGTFSVNFQDFTQSGNPVNNGTFEVYATATYSSDPNHVGPSAPSNTFTGTLTNGSASVTGVSSTTGLTAGEVVTGTGIPSGTTILSVNSLTSTVTLSKNATASGSESLLATVQFQIDNVPPATVTDFRLNPADDTGIVGDDVTTDRTPEFIGTTAPGDIVELFVANQAGVQNTAVASATTSTDAKGKSYNFTIQLPYTLNEGQTTLYIEVVDPAGNVSAASNSVGVALTSTVVDYIPSTTADPTGGSTSDPALFARNTTTNQLQWLVQTPAGAASPWFGASGTLYSSPAGTANVVPFDGDFDADGLTDLAYYNLSTATWTIDYSSKYQPFVFTGTLTTGSATVTGISNTTGLTIGQDVTGTGIPSGTTILTINGLTATVTLSANATASGSQSLTATVPPVSFTMGTANSSVPVVGRFDANGPTEPAVFTINSQGQGVWSIASALTGTYTVTFGQTGDIPVPGDYGGLGYDQLAVYRPSTGQFLVYNPSTPNSPTTLTIPGISTSPDLSSLVPVPGQYDNQAYYNASALQGQNVPIFGHTEAAVYDPKTGVFTILGPNSTVYTVSGFQPGDIPATGDYMGDGEDQVVAFQPSTGQFIEGTVGSNGHTTLTTIATLGQSGDIPVNAPLSYRLPSGDPNAGDPSTGGSGGSSGTGSTGSGSGGSSGTGSTGSSGGSSSTGATGNSSSSSSSTSSSTPSGQSSPTPAPAPVSTSKPHKKVVTKKAHPTKPAKSKKPVKHAKKEAHTVKKVHVTPTVKHKTVVKTAAVTADHASSRSHVVDLALEDVHVNLRRSNAKHHGA
jgi:subtilisin-like proprotein convertase family protein